MADDGRNSGTPQGGGGPDRGLPDPRQSDPRLSDPAPSEPAPSLPADNVALADFTIRRELADLTFLRAEPETTHHGSAMPEDVWLRLSQVMSAEQERRSTGWRRRPRILTAVVAAAAVVIAGGVVVQSRQSAEPALVASDALAPVVTSASRQAEPAENDPAAAPGNSANGADSSNLPGSAELPAVKGNVVPGGSAGEGPFGAGESGELGSGQLGNIAPARRVLASGTDYRPETLGDQVEALLSRLGVTTQRQLEELPQQNGPLTVGSSGFTATEQALQGCLFTLRGPIAASADQAYLVDRATFAGQDVGLILLPVRDGSRPLVAPDPSALLTGSSGKIDIWIVTPACGPLGATSVHHLLHTLSLPRQ